MSEWSQSVWRCRGRDAGCGNRPLIMGILNVTPDSFSDGGTFASTEKAVDRALQMLEEGADIIDIGGESTRPGALPVAADEEIRRTVPVIERLRGRSDCLISIDTMKASTARAALAAGADILNDVSALHDPGMAAVAAESGAGLVLMHMQGSPQTMQLDPHYGEVVTEVCGFLAQRLAVAVSCGISPEQICFDPGIGFGKTDGHNLALLKGIPQLAEAGRPVLIGASRKGFIGRLLGRAPGERLAGSLAAAAYAIGQGARILRVHDVKESCDVVRLLDKISRQGMCG